MTDTQPTAIDAGAHRAARRGRWCILAAAVLWSAGGAFAKAPAFDRWPPEQTGLLLAFWRALFAGVALLPLVRRPRWHRLLLPSGLCFAAMNVAYQQAMQLTTGANAIWLQSTAPLWVFVLARLLRTEPPAGRNRGPLALGALGLGVIVCCELRAGAGSTSPLGVVYGLVSGVCYACVVLCLRGMRAENSAWLVVWNHLCTAALLAPWALRSDLLPTGSQWPLLAAFGVVQMGLPYVLFTRGLQSVSSPEAALLGLLEPLLLPLWLLPREQPAWWTVVGGGLILAGLLMRYLRRRPSAA